jgi:hypothetical protein
VGPRRSGEGLLSKDAGSISGDADLTYRATDPKSRNVGATAGMRSLGLEMQTHTS